MVMVAVALALVKWNRPSAKKIAWNSFPCTFGMSNKLRFIAKCTQTHSRRKNNNIETMMEKRTLRKMGKKSDETIFILQIA